ncbi:hypothetical protein [Cryptosporangium phraense]|uniref:Uncharacterized protein n=1 Tax=Cryptosporangium phraense TaxID=2593070 RepID=A0A545AUM1_9ACTN|nr:hypothetical protein [Cryptosporangium phraense]TQS45038.1 hypothetical protein FL583_11095 [Cryptosporangium phraense]
MTNTTPDRSGPQILRPLLWVLLTIGMIGNAAATALGDNLPAHLAFGLVTLVSGGALIAQYVRRR